MRNLAELGTINVLRSSDLSPPAVNERFIANALLDRGGLLDFGSIVKVSRHYQPITAILYTSRMITVASAIHEDSA